MNTPQPPNGSRTLRLKNLQIKKQPEALIETNSLPSSNQQLTKNDKRFAVATTNIVNTEKLSKKAKKPRQVNGIRDGGIVTTTDGSARIPIFPRPAQKEILDGLFAGPRLIRQLLAECTEPISTDEGASLFMLKHYKDLQPHLYSQRRDDAVNLLRSLIKEWSIAMPDDIELLLPSDCSISSEQKIYLPIPGLGTLSPLDAEAVTRLRTRRRYESGFVLLHHKGKYFVDVAFEKAGNGERQELNPAINTQQHTVSRSTHEAKSHKSRPKSKSTKVSSSAMHIDSFLSMFNNSINRRLMQQLRISQQYSRTNFDKLEGWGVNGGLPSLGKHR
jgi:hypothetical protein